MASRQKFTGVIERESSIRIWFMWKGKRHWETLPMRPTPANLKHANKMRQEICTRIALGVFDYEEFFPDSKTAQRIEEENKKPTFRDIAEKWIKTISNLAPSTISGYRKLLDRYPYPVFGNVQIDKIKYGDLAELLGSIEWGSLKTRNNVATVIRRPFELAFIDGIIDVNPAARIKNMASQKPPPDPFELFEADLIIDKMRERKNNEFANYIEFAFFSGLRTSELLALKWEDIDFNLEIARVSKAKVQNITKGTKTNRVRDVELNSRAINALHNQKKYSFLRGEEVFIDPRTGEGIGNDKVVRKKWTPALKELGIRYRPPYNTRHTFATLNLMAGANPMWVSRQMGHTTMKMLLEVYSRWIDQADKKREKNKLESLLNVPNMCQRAQNER